MTKKMDTIQQTTGGANNLQDSNVFSAKDNKIIEIGKYKYIVGNKLKLLLTDSIMSWETFLEIYGTQADKITLTDEIIKILGLKYVPEIADNLLPVIKEVYKLPNRAHIMCMVKQFMINEPMGISIHNLFMLIKSHYEILVKTFIKVRNKYIKAHKLAEKNLNDLNYLLNLWEEYNVQFDDNSSSTILLYINPPHDIDNELKIKIDDVDGKIKNALHELAQKIKTFKYPGFCPKVPYQRLKILLEFPLGEIITCIKLFDEKYKPINYVRVEKKINEIVAQYKMKNPIGEIAESARKKPPKALKDQELLAWYVNEIFIIRKKNLPYGNQIERFFIEHAQMINEIYNYLAEQFKAVE